MQPTTLSTQPSPAPKIEHGAFPNALSRFVFTRTYLRWVDSKGRRETMVEAVDRYVKFLQQNPKVPSSIIEEIRASVLLMDVMPSMRALWSAGRAATRDNTMVYNCSFLPMDSLKSFSELLYILMMGTGAGYSVEQRFVRNLPAVANRSGKVVQHIIPDSTVGWADAVFEGLTQMWKGHTVDFDYSNIRPEGARLETKGGRASGPGPLENLLEFCQSTIDNASGRPLSPLEVSDIACMIGEIVMAGGVRRAALICFSDPDDLEMRHAKDWRKGDFPACRYMANFSGFWGTKPDRDIFNSEWEALRESGSGERGFFMFPTSKRSERRGDCRSNPCGEILLRYSESTDPWTGEGGGGQFCNLSAAVMRASDTKESFSEKVRIATWIGAIQSTFTTFPYLRPAWAKHCEEDRLLGVDITGHCDNPRLSCDAEAMHHFNQVAVDTAAQAAAYLDIPMPAAITCGKPSGNTSQVVDCASGFHTRHSPYYIRRVRIAHSDPLFRLARDSGAPVFKDVKYQNTPDNECPTWVVEFPVKSPEKAMTRNDESALEQLARYRHVMNTWCSSRGHNQSATIYVREEEWDVVGEWVYRNFNELTGLSFLPYEGGNYDLAPYEEITADEYYQRLREFPNIDYSLLTMYEKEDQGTGAQTLACMGGSCEI